MIGTDRPESDVMLGVQTARATLDRVGRKLAEMPRARVERTMRALELARDALSIVSMNMRGRTSDVLAMADRLARAAAEFRSSLG